MREEGHTDMVQLLLQHNAQVNATESDFFDKTSLHYACEKGHTDVVHILLQNNA
jgi:ankyrin repeat protein